jgi:hypothetical protein
MIFFNDSQYLKNDNIVIYSMEDGAILLNNATQEVTVVNELGAFIWDSVGDEKSNITFDEIIVSIKNEYAITEEDNVEKEANDFLSELIDINILTKSQKERS